MLCQFIGGSGIWYVWQKNQIYELGRQIIEQSDLSIIPAADLGEAARKAVAAARQIAGRRNGARGAPQRVRRAS